MANAPREPMPAPAAERAVTPAEQPARRRGAAPAERQGGNQGGRAAGRGRRGAVRGVGAGRTNVPRGEAAPEAPEPTPKIDPKAAKDPRLQKALAKVQQRAAAVKKHEPPTKKAAQAQAAAVPPANEKLAGAKAQQVDTMKEAEGKKPESDSFLTLLRAEIEKAMPKTLGETDSFMDQGDKQKLKGAATGNVEQQKAAATGDLKSASETPPDPSTVPGKEVTPLPGEPPAPAMPSVGAAEAMPAPKPPAEVSLHKSKQDVNAKLAENKITPQQLIKANDPRFSAVLSSKQAVEQHADAAPAKYRTTEQKTLAQAAAKVVANEKQGLAGMRGQRTRSNTAVQGRQAAAKAKDEARRKEVTDTIEKIFTQTKQAVDTKLNSLETDVTAQFDRGVETALANMKSYVDQRKNAYKAERYGGLGGGVLWAKDKLFGLPDEVKIFYDEGRKLFIAEMDRMIVSIAAMVDTRLKEAKAEVGKGQTRITEYVASLPRDLQAAGKAAEREMASRFAELRAGIDERKNDLAQKLAQRYKEASDKADEALKSMQAEDKGLVTAFVEKLGEIITILRNFKNRIMGLLRKAAATIELIVADPIGFLGNLLSAVKKGINQFKDRIWDHLKAGFIGWLVGSLGSAGITVPRDLSLPSILQLVMQLLGLTYDRIRAKAVRLIGDRNVALLERAWQLISMLIRGGPAALWEQIKEYLSDLKQKVVDELQNWVVTTIIKAAITKLATMFNPVGAIIQAIITIYNTVMFFIERINQIMALVEAIINSVHSIATGAIGAAANWIEQAMARAIPVIISFLARLLGIGGISDKIRSIIQKVQAKVDSALDKLIDKIVKPLKRLFGGGAAGAPGVNRAAPPQDQRRAAAEAAVRADLARMEAAGVTEQDLEAAIPRWKQQHGFRTLTVEAKEDHYVVEGSMSAKKAVGKVKRSGSKQNPFRLNWPKRASAAYPVLYFGGKSAAAKAQSALKGLHSQGKKDAGGVLVRKYDPHVGGPLYESNGKGGEKKSGDKIGLAAKYRIAVGKVIGPLSTLGTPKGGKINNLLRKYGFSPSAEQKDGDHVQEIQFGGDDVLENLWPLDSAENTSAGPTLAGASVQYPTSGKTIKISQLKQKAAKYYFKIVKTK